MSEHKMLLCEKEKDKTKEALILFSGGKDSFLSTLLAIEKGYKVNLITFNNGCELKCNNVLVGAKKIEKMYGSDKVNIIGIKKTDSIWRSLIKEFYNYDTEYINNEFGKITFSQFNCLSCRVAMYILSIIICKQKGIKLIIDGARKNQLFAIEQDLMIKDFKSLFDEYDLEISYPLLEKNDDYEIKNAILARGFVPKMNEAQCLMGIPLNKDEISIEIIQGCHNIYYKELYPKINRIFEDYKDVKFREKYL